MKYYIVGLRLIKKEQQKNQGFKVELQGSGNSFVAFFYKIVVADDNKLVVFLGQDIGLSFIGTGFVSQRNATTAL